MGRAAALAAAIAILLALQGCSGTGQEPEAQVALPTAAVGLDDGIEGMDAPAEPSYGGHELTGRWVRLEGAWLWHFGDSESVELRENGTAAHGGGESRWEPYGAGRFRAWDPGGDMLMFAYTLDGSELTVTDYGGDNAVWAREGYERPARDAGGILDPELYGMWEWEGGEFLFFFASGGGAEFGMDGGVMEHAYGEHGEWLVTAPGELTVESAWTGTHTFAYSAGGGMLTVTDSAGDTARWRKAEERPPDGGETPGAPEGGEAPAGENAA